MSIIASLAAFALIVFALYVIIGTVGILPSRKASRKGSERYSRTTTDRWGTTYRASKFEGYTRW